MKTTWTIKLSTFDSALVNQGDILSVWVDGEFLCGWRGAEWVAPPKYAEKLIHEAEKLRGPNGGFFNRVDIDVAPDGRAVVSVGDEYIPTLRCGGYAHARCVAER
jgi:hypothetical protein